MIQDFFAGHCPTLSESHGSFRIKFLSQMVSFENQSTGPGRGTDWPPGSPIVIYLPPNEWTLATTHPRKVQDSEQPRCLDAWMIDDDDDDDVDA